MQQNATLFRVSGALIWLNQAVLALERHFLCNIQDCVPLVTLGDRQRLLTEDIRFL
jgi:hypothetical protein